MYEEQGAILFQEIEEAKEIEEAAARKDARDAQLDMRAKLDRLVAELYPCPRLPEEIEKFQEKLKEIQAERHAQDAQLEMPAGSQSLTVELEKLDKAAAEKNTQIEEKQAAIQSLIGEIEKLEEIEEVVAMLKRRRLRS